MTAPVFVLTDLSTTDSVLELSGTEGRHAVSSLRLGVGEAVDLVDGIGRRVTGEIIEVSGRECARVRVIAVTDEPEPMPHITVVQALPKGERGELAVELLTEVGVDVIVPWAARNCVAQWRGERADRGLRKWTDAAQAAAKQARRARFPVVEPLASTADVVARLAEASVGLVLHETATAAIGSVATEGVRDFVLVVGPEGGIDPNELAAFSSAGAETVVLGPSVLRTSSAGMAGAAALLARTSRWDGRMAP